MRVAHNQTLTSFSRAMLEQSETKNKRIYNGRRAVIGGILVSLSPRTRWTIATGEMLSNKTILDKTIKKEVRFIKQLEISNTNYYIYRFCRQCGMSAARSFQYAINYHNQTIDKFLESVRGL